MRVIQQFFEQDGDAGVHLEVAKGSLHEALHFQTLLLSDSRAQAKSRNASSNPSFNM